MNALDRAIAYFAPAWAARRAVARVHVDAARTFEANAKGRRGETGWMRGAQAAGGTSAIQDVTELRARARYMSKNAPYWSSAQRAITNLVVGAGIRASVVGANKRRAGAVQAAWDAWADSTDCDAAGDSTMYALQTLIMSSLVGDGEALVLRRQRRGEPLRLQVLGADYLASSADRDLGNGARIVGGVEIDGAGRAVAYHLFRDDPALGGTAVVRYEARDVIHAFDKLRPGQVRGESWIAPVYTRLVDWDDYEDADLMRQKVAACFGAVYTGVTADSEDYEAHERIEPGMVDYLPAGADVKVIAPPASAGIRDAYTITMRAIASGLGITYEELTGDFSGVNFSSGRLAAIRMHRNVRRWQRDVMIARVMSRVFAWFLESQTLARGGEGAPLALDVRVGKWITSRSEMIDPEKETNANRARVRAGFQSWSSVVREQGDDPETVAAELAADQKLFDDNGLVLDIDPRKVSAQGQGSINQKDPTDGSQQPTA